MKRFGCILLAFLFTFLTTFSIINASTLQSAYKIGVTQFTNSSEFGNAPQFIIDTFINELPKSLNVKTRKVPDEVIFDNKDSIIAAGAKNGVDVLLTGTIGEYTIKRDFWLGGIYAKVRVEARLYSAGTGELLWSGTVTERYWGDTEIHCLQKATRETVWSLKKAMIAAGLQGRPNDTEKPTFTVQEYYLSPTSVYFLEGTVKDNFAVSRLNVNGQSVPLTNEGQFTYMATLTTPVITLALNAEDEAGNVSSTTVHISKSGTLDGNIAQIIGNKIIINKGFNDNVSVGTGFTVSTVQKITDPVTGNVLDSLTTDVAIIKIIEVKDRLAIAELISILNGGKISVGDYIY